RFSGHADVMQVVLNKMDTVPPGQGEALLGDLARLLADDGLPGMTPVPTSAVTPGGVDVLRGILTGEVTARQAALERIDADLRAQAVALRELTRTTAAADGAGLPAALQQRTATGLAAAAGVDQIAALVAAQHRRDASLATGWPPMRWQRRLRRAPLARLETTTGNQVATAEVSRTLRATAVAATGIAGPRWADAASVAVRGRVEEVTAALDQEVSRDVQVLRRPPRWWGVVAGGHRLLLLVALAGALWLGGIAAAQALLLVDARPFTPYVGAVPLPTVLLLGGLVGGVALAMLAGIAARVGARRQARRATTSLRQAVDGVTRDQVMAPLQAVLADRDEVEQLLVVAAGDG
ncbi:MAG TPA: hypothetical protein VMM13_01570, partial [Euzebya sp.]|nr:hypothetical protein [Euzebya sp.]